MAFTKGFVFTNSVVHHSLAGPLSLHLRLDISIIERMSRPIWPCTKVILFFLLVSVAPSVVAQPLPKSSHNPGEPLHKVKPPPFRSAEVEHQPSQTTLQTPSDDTLGVSIYPNAQYLVAYDARRGQQYYLFGTNASFENMVDYYSAVLNSRGDRVFREPPVHMFELGRFDRDTMAFPPSVTIKDYTWNGAAGYPNSSPGGQPSHYSTIIQIVPVREQR